MSKNKTKETDVEETPVVENPSPPKETDTNRFNRKPTKAQMQAEMDNALKDLESLPPEPEEDEPEDEKPEDVEEVEEDQEEDEPEEEEPEEEDQEEPAVTSKKEEYRKRYEDSSREAHILYSKNKKMSEAIEGTLDIPEPTDKELRQEYPEWDDMTDFEQKMAIKDVINTRKLDAISAVARDFKDMDAWNGKVDSFLADPETLVDHPRLDGQEEEFKIFASKETRRGVDMDTLVSAFLYEVEDKRPPQKKGKMLETGSGGQNIKHKPKSNKLSVQDSNRLRQTNYKKYVELLRAGKVTLEVD